MEPGVAIQYNVSFGDWLNYVLAFILFLIAVRSIIIANTNKDYSNGNWFQKIFLARKEEITAKFIAKELGFDSLSDVKKAVNKYKGDELENFVKLLSNSTIKSDAKFKFGDNNESSYYVDTMGTSANKKDCIFMKILIQHLIDSSPKKIRNFDYVFSRKGGNISLVSSFITSDEKQSIIAKDKEELANPTEININLNDSTIKYEGLQSLKKYATKKRGDVIGIAIDCNLSGGSTLRKAIVEFNNTIKELQKNTDFPKNIKPIENVFILYRAINTGDFDKAYLEDNMNCYRYFDLSENSKKILYEIKNDTAKINDFICLKCINGNDKLCDVEKCYKIIK